MKIKLFYAAIMSMAVLKSFAIASESKPLKAIPSDTVSATIKVCNFYRSPVKWAFKSIGNENIVVAGIQYLEQNTCSLVGLRKPISSTASVQVNVSSNEVEFPLFSSFILSEISQTSSYYPFPSQITKYMKASEFNGTDLIKTYSSNGWAAVSLSSNPNMQNLSGGVVPDFVLCVGGDNSQCNDSFGNQ